MTKCIWKWSGKMLDNLKYEDYLAELNTKFKLAETSTELELIEVTQRKLTSQQEMFSLIFSGAKDNFLEQKIYRMHHEKLGEGELFLVPIAEKADGYRYEAGFNRIIG
jgi:hypothetical protein